MKMKKAYSYLIGFFSLTILFTLCYFISYKAALNQFNKNSSPKDNLLLSYEKVREINLEASRENNVSKALTSQQELTLVKDVESIAVDTSNHELIKPSTVYYLETYDIKEDTLETKELNTPEFLVGLSRLDVMSYLNNYISEVPLEDFEKGLVSYELISFSPQKVVLRKSYNKDNVQFRYYLAVQGGYLTVYYSDKKTIYEYTNILIDDLSEEDQVELIHGKYIKDLEELYGILQNYTS